MSWWEWFHTEPVSTGTCWDNITGSIKKYVDKHNVTYATFLIQNNQTCIIINAEVIPSTGTIFMTRVFPSNKTSRDTGPGSIPHRRGV